MQWRRATSLRLAVAGLLVLSFGLQPMPACSAMRVDHAAAIAASAPLSETLALPSGRGDGQLAVHGRERSPAPLVPVEALSVAASRSVARALSPLAPHARSHPARHVRPHGAADDPPPH